MACHALAGKGLPKNYMHFGLDWPAMSWPELFCHVLACQTLAYQEWPAIFWPGIICHILVEFVLSIFDLKNVG